MSNQSKPSPEMKGEWTKQRNFLLYLGAAIAVLIELALWGLDHEIAVWYASLLVVGIPLGLWLRIKHLKRRWVGGLVSIIMFTLFAVTWWGIYKKIRQASFVLLMPQMGLNTIEGLSGPKPGTAFTNSETSIYREHHLSVTNLNRFDLRDFDFNVRIPEPIAEKYSRSIALKSQVKGPPGLRYNWRRDDMDWRSVGGVSRPYRFTRQWKLQIECVPALGSVSLPFLTVEPLRSFESMTETNSQKLHLYVLGVFQYSVKNEWRTQEILMPLLFDPTNRIIRSLPTENTYTNWDIDRSFGLGW